MPLVVNNLEAGYGKLQILHGVSIELDEDETIALIGANGAGKTTVLRAIMNLVQVMAGDILLDDVRLNGKPWFKIAQMGISFIPQKREVFAPLTVLENLEVGAYCIRKDKRKIRQNLNMIMDLFPHLRTKLGVPAGLLSGGEQKMLSIARGLMGNPRIVLLDEPSLGLSPSLSEELFDKIRQISQISPSIKGVLLVEQNAYLALEIASRGYVLETGRVVLTGNARELMENPHVKKAYLAA